MEWELPLRIVGVGATTELCWVCCTQIKELAGKMEPQISDHPNQLTTARGSCDIVAIKIKDRYDNKVYTELHVPNTISIADLRSVAPF